MKVLLQKCWKWLPKIWAGIVVFAALFGLWVGYLQVSEKTSLTAQILSETSVLAVNASVSNLQILFQGQDIQQNNLGLRIYRIRFQNNGGTNITQNDFDQNNDWGISVASGTAVEVHLIDSNSPYINANLSPQIENPNTVKFNKVIIDKGDSFVVDVLVLYNKDAMPSLSEIGKIAGIEGGQSQISLVDQTTPFWITFLDGGWLINLSRMLIWGVIGVILFFTIIILILKIQKQARKPQQAQQPKQNSNG